MKTIRLLQVAMLSAIVALTSCNKDELSGSSSEKEVTVTLSTQLPSPTAKTRAINEEIADIDGFHLRYIMEVWTKETAPKLYKKEVVAANGQNQAQFNVSLLNGREFDILLWADYARDGYDDDLHYNTGSESGLKAVTRSNPTTNTPYVDEEKDYKLAPTRDAFFAHVAVTASADVTENITLKRAVSQLNIYTTDYEAVPEGFKPASTKVTISSASSFNVLGGSSFGSADWTTVVAINPTAADSKNNVFTGYYFTSAKGKNIVNFDANFSDALGGAITTYSMSNIPIQQNYRTKITGALLAKQGAITVETEAAYDGNHDDNTPITPPTEDGIWYSADGGAWAKWNTTISDATPVMPEGSYTSFVVKTIGDNNKINLNHLKAIAAKNVEVVDLGNATYKDTYLYAAFNGNKALRSIILPKNITTISGYGFKNCSNLTNVVLQEGLTKFDIGVFQFCTGLTKLVLPESVTTFANAVFDGCENLETINIPRGAENYGESVFRNCKKLSIDVVLPTAMKKVPNNLFFNCANLRSVKLPEGLETIGYAAFSGVELTEIVIPAGVIKIEAGAFMNATISSIVLPERIDAILGQTFKGCDLLKSITIPRNVTSIGQEAFRKSGLESVTIPKEIATLGTVIFADMPNLKTAVIEEGENQLTFGLGFFYQSRGLESVTFPSNTKAFDNRVLWGCDKLSAIKCKAMQAPSVKFEDFGTIMGSQVFLTGLKVVDQKVLYVPEGATGYESETQADGSENYWKTVLLNPQKCGYTIQYVDFKNVQTSASAGEQDWKDGGTIAIK